MPVEKSRHYTGRPAPLGVAAIWDCPGCGMKNEGRLPEQGCTHCGAGTPGQAAVEVPHAEVSDGQEARAATPPMLRQATTARASESLTKVYRLLEYTVTEGHDLHEVLRRSLVGQMRFPWGTITGTIVDSLDSRQQDLLQLAARQPGVWLGEPMHTTAQQVNQSDIQAYSRKPRSSMEINMNHPIDPPPSILGGPLVSADAHNLALEIRNAGGYPLAYTLALALQQIAEEVEGNMESHKLLSKAQCLELATALLQLVPDDWQPEQEAPPT